MLGHKLKPLVYIIANLLANLTRKQKKSPIVYKKAF